MTGLPDGQTCYFAATAVNQAGTESGTSNEAIALIESDVLTLQTVGGPVYAQAFTQNALGMIAVGNVPAGMACDPTQFIRAFGSDEVRYVVPGLGYAQAVVSVCVEQ
jgi:hypothetical protein